ncbi:MAG: leucyl/phenylalanyl-tRNA--protein transferase [Burkholderiaceae bacterium]|nr:leucyl/phenylalanyl-tRNA--protein transferase [Burkholderiaceae bacterium]
MDSKQHHTELPLPWLEAGDAFPPVTQAGGLDSTIPGLLAAGGALDVATLKSAYSQGIFPWFSEGQPILWWSTDPRMVLQVADFKLQPSLRKTLQKFRTGFNGKVDCAVRFDTAFDQVIAACALSLRPGQDGTWIVPKMVHAYLNLHKAGYAHSVETWVNGALVGGLYCVNIGGVVFGESMFSRATDASKIALAALVCFCRANEVTMIDCQQNTPHLASLGAREMPRSDFVDQLGHNIDKPAPVWRFEPHLWNQLLPLLNTRK